MKLFFKNGSYIKVIETPENQRVVEKEPDMSDIDWFCALLGIELHTFQKVYLWLRCRDEIRRMREVIRKIGACIDIKD